jgi:hypothetical protein
MSGVGMSEYPAPKGTRPYSTFAEGATSGGEKRSGATVYLSFDLLVSATTTSPQIVAKRRQRVIGEGAMPSPVRSIVPLVAAAVASGVLSYATEGLPRLSHELQALLTSYLINPQLMLPGVWFGLVTGALAWRLGSRGAIGAVLSLVITWVGWQLAVQAGIAAFDRLGGMTTDETIRLAAAGVGGGAVGALVSFIGVRIGTPMRRTLLAGFATLAVGAAFGLLLVWSSTRQSAGLLLYATWQPAVIAVMAYFANSRSAQA